MYYAHSRNVQGQRQELEAHLRAVAALAAEFAAPFGGQEIARFAGLWHDAGKLNPRFQEYLLGCEAGTAKPGSGPDHKAAGARLAVSHLPLLALLMQGHHGGLRTTTDLQAWLARLQTEDPAGVTAVETARRLWPDIEPDGPLPLPAAVERDPLAADLFLRMCFSALIDADRLDTEAHFERERGGQRGTTMRMPDLWARFAADQAHFSQPSGPVVAEVRTAVYEACLAAAELPPGLFRLTVPTGGGKTRSGMAFALRHALRYGQQRIVVAVPFISITEQTADVYRRIFEPVGSGDRPVVLEHHSGMAPDEAEGFDPGAVWQRLGAENWDAPIVVTTTVQLFESLFANQTSRARKLHRLARSVIILDEAQALPPPLLRPILDMLRRLCADYGATVVLSTATQPAFDTIRDFRDLSLREIVPDPARYFAALKRVEYDWQTDRPQSWDDVAARMRGAPRALAIVNTKKDALALLDGLDDPAALHLSTLLCGAHRRQVIAEVKRRQAAGQPCRLVSTQVVEAGVDLDFPLVLRALAPLDGIIQAAGRCNREGRLARGLVVVFDPAEGGLPLGAYRTGTNITAGLVGSADFDADSPGAARTYFTRLFDSVETDREGIQRLRERFEFPEVAQRFRMIDDDTQSVAVPFGTPREQVRVDRWLAALAQGGPGARALLRRLQPYTVTLRAKEARRQGDSIAPVVPGLGRWLGGYDPVRGLTTGRLALDSLVV